MAPRLKNLHYQVLLETPGGTFEITPGETLHQLVRAGFIAQGTSLDAWCREREVARQNAYKALRGIWKGPRAEGLRLELVLASSAFNLQRVSPCLGMSA